MTEQCILVETLLVVKQCDNCLIGTMKATGSVLLMNPPIHVHQCSNCGEQAKYRESYPKQITRRKPGAEWMSIESAMKNETLVN